MHRVFSFVSVVPTFSKIVLQSNRGVFFENDVRFIRISKQSIVLTVKSPCAQLQVSSTGVLLMTGSI